MKNKVFQIISKYGQAVGLVILSLVLIVALFIIRNQSKAIKDKPHPIGYQDLKQMKEATDSLFDYQTKVFDKKLAKIYEDIDSIQYNDKPILEELDKIKKNVHKIRKEINTETNWADSSISAILYRVESLSD